MNSEIQEFQLKMMEDVIIARLPPDDQKKIEMSRVALREMMKLDPTVRFAILAVAIEQTIECQKLACELAGMPPTPP